MVFLVLWLLTFYSPSFASVILPQDVQAYHLPIVLQEELSEATSCYTIEEGILPSEEVNLEKQVPIVELASYPDSPSINYRRLIPEHQPQSNTRSQALVGLLTGFVWVGAVAFEHKRRSKVRRRYYFSKCHVRIVKRRRR